MVREDAKQGICLPKREGDKESKIEEKHRFTGGRASPAFQEYKAKQPVPSSINGSQASV